MKELEVKVGTGRDSTEVKIDGEDLEITQYLNIEATATDFTRFTVEGMFNPSDENKVELHGYYLTAEELIALRTMVKDIRDTIEDLGYDKLDQYPALRRLYILANDGVKWMPQAK